MLTLTVLIPYRLQLWPLTVVTTYSCDHLHFFTDSWSHLHSSSDTWLLTRPDFGLFGAVPVKKYTLYKKDICGCVTFVVKVKSLMLKYLLPVKQWQSSRLPSVARTWGLTTWCCRLPAIVEIEKSCSSSTEHHLKASTDAMDVCQVHEENLGVGIILGTLHTSPSRPVTHCCRVACWINYQHLSIITKAGGSFSWKMMEM